MLLLVFYMWYEKWAPTDANVRSQASSALWQYRNFITITSALHRQAAKAPSYGGEPLRTAYRSVH